MSEEFCKDTFLTVKNVMGSKMDYVIDTYVTNSNSYIAVIESGLSEGDYTKIEDAAHPLASSSATLGAMGFAKIAKDIEDISSAEVKGDEDLSTLKDLTLSLPESFERAEAFLRQQ